MLAGFGTAAHAVVIETVRVGNAGNDPDTTGYGAVGYRFNIGKHEVTAGQYAEFLNSVATVTDTYGLYNEMMWISDEGYKIQRTSVLGNYAYSVPLAYANRPVNLFCFNGFGTKPWSS